MSEQERVEATETVASAEDLCAHGCGLDATVAHADGRYLCYPCYRVEVEDADLQWRETGSCPVCRPVEVPRLGGVYRADGESWEAYARRLEVRIKEQRDLLQHLNALKREWADRHDRRRIVRMERALGRVTEKWQYEREARISLVEKVKTLEAALTTATAPLSSPRSSSDSPVQSSEGGRPNEHD